MYKYLFCTLALLFSSMAIANNCNNPRDDFDGLYCLNKVYQQADKDLNTAYKKLKRLLKKRDRKTLRNRQRSWIEDRNDSCSFYRDGMFFVSLRCTTDITIDRTNQLTNRIRECKATGCQPRKL